MSYALHVAPIFAVIGLGAWLGWRGLRLEKHDKGKIRGGGSGGNGGGGWY